jgi:two-component system, cell cycle sensor histidine kinase and response regulator CckA
MSIAQERARMSAEPNPAAVGDPDAEGRILLVDDSPLVRALVGNILRRTGYQVCEAPNGAVALQMMEAQPFDVVLSDLRMPQLDGFGLLESVKSRHLESEVIILTGTHANDVEAAVRALRLGANDFITKPLSGPDQVLVAVARAVERKRERDARRASEERYRLLFERNLAGVCRITLAGRPLTANDACRKIFGYATVDDLVRSFTWAAHFDEDEPEFLGWLRKERYLSGIELPFRRADGQQGHLLANLVLVAADPTGNEAIEGTLVDVTPHKEAEAALRRTEHQLRQAQKMEAVGRLAGGIAHDFNNLLSVIIGYCGLLSADPAPHLGRVRVEQIEKAAEKAATLTRQLLAFGRKQVLQPEVVRLGAIVAEVESMLRRVIGEDVQLATRLDAALWPVFADPGQIEQVILNLALNARDAMPEGGRLIIETANAHLDEDYVANHPGARVGPHAVLSVTDTGCGMTPDTLSHVFEPFFTTKPAGQGTGLGLAMVYGIVKQSGGYIDVVSEPGLGATFKIYLPQARAAAGAAVSAHPRPQESPGGSETILLVEDEPGLRAVLREILASSGYTVIEAENSEDAVARARAAGPIHCLLTDVVMPHMSGPEVADRIKQCWPDAVIVYMSGYSEEALSQRGTLHPPGMLLRKPLGRASLLGTLRQALDRSAAVAPPAVGSRAR